MNKKFEIWCKTKNTLGKEKMFWCQSIYQRWGEEDKPFKRRAKRNFTKYKQEHEQEGRTFYLLENE